jgi:hypothetical protein
MIRFWKKERGNSAKLNRRKRSEKMSGVEKQINNHS